MPVITTNFAPNPSFESVATGTTTFRTNLANDPRATAFKASTVQTMGWQNEINTLYGSYSLVTGAPDGPVSDITTYARYSYASLGGGSPALELAGTYLAATPGAKGFPVVAGTTYTFSLYARLNGKGTRSLLVLGIRFIDSDTVWNAAPFTTYAPPIDEGKWQRLSVKVTVPPTAVRVAAYLAVGAGGNSVPGVTTLDGTGLMVEQSDTLREYFDGTTPNPKGWTTAWAGTTNNSASTAKTTLSEIRRNQATNPRVTAYSGGTVAVTNGRWFGNGAPTPAGTYTIVTGASDGPDNLGLSTYGRKTWTTPPPAIGNSGDTGFNCGTGGVNGLAVTAGQVVTASAYVRPSVLRNNNVIVQPADAAGAALTRSSGSLILCQPNVWTRISYSYTVPAGVSFLSFAFDSTASSTNGAVVWATGSTFDIAGVLIEVNSALGTYFDGTLGNVEDGYPTFVGTTNASASILSAPVVSNFASVGNQSLVWQHIEGGDNMARARFITTAAIGFNFAGMSLTPGVAYTIRAEVRPNDRDFVAQMRLLGATSGEFMTFTTGIWNTVMQTFTAGASGNTGFLISADSGRDTYGTVDIRNLLIAPASTYTAAEGYFDGDTINGFFKDYAWLGTPHASSSTVAYKDLAEQPLPGLGGLALANSSKGRMRVIYRSGWLG